TRTHSTTTLLGTFCVGRCGSRFLSGSYRLSEPLVPTGGPREGDEQLHGGDSSITAHRIAHRRLDTRAQLVYRPGLAVALRIGGSACHFAGHRRIFLSNGLAE